MKAEVTRLRCEVRQGTREDARWFAYSANQTHGQRRSNPDKQRAVLLALKHPNGAKMSDEKIAEHVGVSPPTVAKYRRESASTLKVLESPARTGRDGRTIDTTNIGRKRSNGEQTAVAAEEDEAPDDTGAAVAEIDDAPPKRRGVGVYRANEAINCLIRIPENDFLRKRGFEIVTDWIEANEPQPATELIEGIAEDIERTVTLVKKSEKGLVFQRETAAVNLRLAKKYVKAAIHFFSANAKAPTKRRKETIVQMVDDIAAITDKSTMEISVVALRRKVKALQEYVQRIRKA